MANYAIMRIEKRKLPSVGRINKHHERLKEEYKSNPDIDRGRTGMNYHIIAPSLPYRDAVLARIEQAGARRRKDSVVLQDCFVGGTPDWLKAKSREEQREYFSHAYQFFEDNFGKEYHIRRGAYGRGYSPYAPLLCPHHRQGPLVLQRHYRRATGPCKVAGQVL